LNLPTGKASMKAVLTRNEVANGPSCRKRPRDWSSLDRGDLKLARSSEITSAIVLANCTDSAIGPQPNEDDQERHIKFESFDLLSCIDIGNAEFI
jgi:hypothetical protein